MTPRWPATEAAQADYENLRAAVLAGLTPVGPAASVFAHAGLPGLITHPSSAPIYRATLLGAHRPRWTPHADPRLDDLAAGYAFLVELIPDPAQRQEIAR
jgi:hypothetical protein